MVTKFAPVYATLVIGYLEEKLYAQIRENVGEHFKWYFIKYWNRFLDDCFIPWNKSLDDLHILERILNSLHEDIKFTLEYSKNEQPFLEVLVKKIGTKIEKDVYYKPTDSKQFLIFNACHPKHTKTSIPYLLARRLK